MSCYSLLCLLLHNYLSLEKEAPNILPCFQRLQIALDNGPHSYPCCKNSNKSTPLDLVRSKTHWNWVAIFDGGGIFVGSVTFVKIIVLSWRKVGGLFLIGCHRNQNLASRHIWLQVAVAATFWKGPQTFLQNGIAIPNDDGLFFNFH